MHIEMISKKKKGGGVNLTLQVKDFKGSFCTSSYNEKEN